MAFPASPSNNQVHKEGNRAFVYDSTLGVWDQVREADSAENEILSGNIDGGTIGAGVTFPAGHVIQTTTATTSTSATYNQNTWAHVLSVSITPKFSNSKIMVSWSCINFYQDNDGNLGYGFRIRRHAPFPTDVFGKTNTIGGGYQYAASYLSGNHQGVCQNGGSAIDSPATASQVTYHMQLDDSGCNSIESQYGSTPSWLIAQEIKV
jgi:hypothetical protein